MNLKELRKLQKGHPGTLPVMVYKGKGQFEELTAEQVRFDILESDNYDDTPAFFLGGPTDEEDEPNP